MKKLIRQEQAITLIALVITIIILLILAGITINLALAPDGIIKRAQEAEDRYTTEQDKEIAGIGELENKLDEIADKIMGNTSGGNEDVDDSVLALKVGDYIKYDTGVSTVGENGVATFRVLYPADSEYGLQIVSWDNLEDISFKIEKTLEEARTTYNGVVSTLNNATEKYLNETYATDVRCVGSLPTLGNDGKFTEKNHVNTNTVKLSDKFPGYTQINGEGLEDDTGFYDSDNNFETDYNQLWEALSDYGWNAPFWLASVGFEQGNDNASYNYCFCAIAWPRGKEMIEGDITFYFIYDRDNVVYGEINSDYDEISYGLRPCIALKQNEIKITGGTGEEGSPYTIGLK